MTIFQTKEWEEFKLATGYQKSWRIFDLLVLEKKIPLLGSMLYAPMLSHDQTKLATEKIFVEQLRKIAKERNAIFFRLESADEVSETDEKRLKKFDFKKSFEEMQPEHTLLIDLAKDDQTILSEMKQKGRYNIKIAEKYQIKVEDCSIMEFFLLYSQMAKRHKISFRSQAYFEKLVDSFKNTDYVKVFGAKTPEGKLLASAVTVFYKGEAIYLFGGSSDEEREKMAPYKLQFEMIKEARTRGCKTYDFYGIAPNDDPDHPWAGVSRFKRQFGGRELSTLGSWDMVFSPTKYQLFKVAEKIRR